MCVCMYMYMQACVGPVGEEGQPIEVCEGIICVGTIDITAQSYITAMGYHITVDTIYTPLHHITGVPYHCGYHLHPTAPYDWGTISL